MAELTREQIGNQADEQGAFENGADPHSINCVALPQGRFEPVEVDVNPTPSGVELVPKLNGKFRGLGDLREGPTSITAAQLFEEPEESLIEKQQVNGIEVYATRERAVTVSQRRELLVWYGMHPEYFGAVLGERVMVRRDVLESEYTCKACSGTGYTDEACSQCGGAQTVQQGDTSVPCPSCTVLGYTRESPWSSGHVQCSSCRGSGWRSGIIIPEVSQSKPITGVVVSVGPDCKLLRIGDRVIHSKYAGHELEINKHEAYTLMQEREVIGILKQREA